MERNRHLQSEAPGDGILRRIALREATETKRPWPML